MEAGRKRLASAPALQTPSQPAWGSGLWTSLYICSAVDGSQFLISLSPSRTCPGHLLMIREVTVPQSFISAGKFFLLSN